MYTCEFNETIVLKHAQMVLSALKGYPYFPRDNQISNRLAAFVALARGEVLKNASPQLLRARWPGALCNELLE